MEEATCNRDALARGVVLDGACWVMASSRLPRSKPGSWAKRIRRGGGQEIRAARHRGENGRPGFQSEARGRRHERARDGARRKQESAIEGERGGPRAWS